MNYRKFLIYSVLIAILAGLVSMLTHVMEDNGFITHEAGLTFVAFIGWATYFLLGANIKSAVNGFLSIIVGIISAILMFVLVFEFYAMGYSLTFIAVPLAVFILVIFMIHFEKAPHANNVAAIFLGAGVYFALMEVPAIASTGYINVAIGQLVYTVIGFFAGWLTIVIRVAIETSGEKNSEVLERVK